MGYKGMKYWRPSSVPKYQRVLIELVLKIPLCPHIRFLTKKWYYRYGWYCQIRISWKYWPRKSWITYEYFKRDDWFLYVNPEFRKLHGLD